MYYCVHLGMTTLFDVKKQGLMQENMILMGNRQMQFHKLKKFCLKSLNLDFL